jgi:soluble lytic murein transglycosylase-like protein
MVFIEGVGYVNDSSAVATPNRTQSVSETTTNFDGMLRTETDKLNQASVTTNLDSIFKEAADKYSVPERLLKAIAYTESGFQANATSSAGAMGIMQLMPSTASAYGVSDPYDAYQNIMGGAAVLKDLLNMFQGNQSLAIAGYNAGCGKIWRRTTIYRDAELCCQGDKSDADRRIGSCKHSHGNPFCKYLFQYRNGYKQKFQYFK